MCWERKFYVHLSEIFQKSTYMETIFFMDEKDFFFKLKISIKET